jgi:hypothetical protein
VLREAAGGRLKAFTRRQTGRWGVRPHLLVLALSLLLLVQQGTISGFDQASTYQVTRALVETRDIAVPRGTPQVSRGRDGRYYSRYGIGLPLLSTVPYVLAKPLEGLLGSEILTAAVATLMPIVTALLCLVLYEIGRALGGRPRDAALVALAAVFGTFLVVYSKDFFSEPLLALAIALALWRTVRGHPTQAAACLAFGMLTRPQAALLAPVFWLYWFHRWGLLRSVLPALVVAAGVGSLFFYNWIRFEDLTETGYPPDQRFTTHLWTGAWGLLTHPNKTVFLFVPPVVLLPLGIWALNKRGQTALAGLITGIVLVAFLTVAAWTLWHGDWAWGPRLLLPALIPALPVLALWVQGSARNRRIVGVLALVGALVNLPAIVVPASAQLVERPLQRGPSVVRHYELVPPALRTASRNLSSSGADPRYFYIWQTNVRRNLGGSGVILAALLSMFLAAVAVVSGVLLRRALHTDPDGD